MKEIKIYEAFDGKQFDKEMDCRRYERENEEKVVNLFKELVIKTLDVSDLTGLGEDFFLASTIQDWKYSLVKIDSVRDYEILKNYFVLRYSETKIPIDIIGKEIIICTGENFNAGEYWGTIDECVEQYRKALMKFKED